MSTRMISRSGPKLYSPPSVTVRQSTGQVGFEPKLAVREKLENWTSPVFVDTQRPSFEPILKASGLKPPVWNLYTSSIQDMTIT